MEPRRTQLRRRPSVAVVAVVASLVAVSALAGCNGPVGAAPAATVNGRTISRSQVLDLLEAQERWVRSRVDDPDETLATQAQDQLSTLMGAGPDSFSMTSASQAVESWINYTLVLSLLESQGEEVLDSDREEARAGLVEQVGGEEALEQVDPALVEFSIDSGATFLAFRRVTTMTQEEQAARAQEILDQMAKEQPVCLSAIASSAEADARAAMARVQGGDDFATVAAEVSIDPNAQTNGGDYGCDTVEAMTTAVGQDLSKATAGQLIGPINQGEAWFVIQVTSVTGPSLQQAQSDIQTQLTAEDEEAINEVMTKFLADAEVSVDPRFGTWSAEDGRVTPPA